MKIHVVWLILALIPLAACGQSKADSTEAVAEYHNSITVTQNVFLYEGLPHQRFERGLFQREIDRKEVIEIAGYPFYTPVLSIRDQGVIKKILGDPKSFKRFSGEKLCGGFHPDYCVSWDSAGNAFYVLICFNCQEVIFSDGDGKYRYGLEQGAYEALKRELSEYVSKRPKMNED